MAFRPMLSADCDALEKLTFPFLASPKLDGIRCVILNSRPLTRTLKAIPNAYITSVLSELKLPMLDGELIVGPPTSKTVWNETQSGVMSRDGEPDFVYHVFDDFTDMQAPFAQRLESARQIVGAIPPSLQKHFKVVDHTLVEHFPRLMALEEIFVSEGYEGIMLRDPRGIYKTGRSTFRERGLIKIKRFFDAEARIIGFKERMHNGNAATIDERGLTKRSTHKANKTPMGTLGALICEIDVSLLDYTQDSRTVEFDIGTGFDDATRQHIWDNQEKFLDKLAKFKYQELTVNGAPRFGVFLGIRDGADL